MTLLAPPSSSTGPQKRSHFRRPTKIAASLAATLSLAAFPFLGVGVAQAAVGGSATAQAAQIDLLLDGALIPDLDLDLGLDVGVDTPLVSAPANNGEVNTSVVGADVAIPLVDVDLGAVTANSARTVSTVESSSSVAGTTIGLFGNPLLGVDAISSSAVCNVDGTITTASEVAGLIVGGTPVDLSVDAAASVPVDITVAGLLDASVQVDVSRVADNVAGVAQGLNVGLTLNATVESTGTVVSLPLGSIILAESLCATPLADPLPPTLSALTPPSGPTAGGTLVTLTGTGFDASTTVTVNDLPAGETTFISPTSLTFVTPASEVAGPVSVVASSPSGPSNALSYEYIAPTLTSVTPDSGSTLGGQSVEIVGTGFTPGAAVSFGTVPSPGVTVNSSTSITAITPPGSAGLVAIDITLPGLDLNAPDAFLYVAPAVPTITSITPTSGPTSGNQSVEIVGTDFTPDSSVTFGGIPATSVVVNSPTSITAITPPSAAGVVDVIVNTPLGDSLPFDYTYIAPSIDAVTPNFGPVTGATTVTITGSGLSGTTAVNFGAIPAASFIVNSDTSITTITPPGVAGTVDVSALIPGQSATLEDAFEYLVIAAPPTLTDITPDSGPVAGNSNITIIGTNFTPDSIITFGDEVVLNFTVIAPTMIEASVPAGELGIVDVVVTTPQGASNALPYEYLAPALTSVSPSSGPTSGGTVVLIEGEGFVPDSQVFFDDAPALNVVILDGNSIQAVTPAGAAGPADVSVTVPGGSVVLEGGFNYVAPAAPPVITGLTPGSGPVSGGQTVTILGSGFTPGTTINFGNVPLAPSTITETSITLITPPGVGGQVLVTANNDGGPPSNALPYLYEAPLVSAVTPNTGSTEGGTEIQVTGEGFGPGLRVVINGADATNVRVLDSRTILATTPRGTPGPASLSVILPSGTTTTAPNAFTYLAPAITPTANNAGTLNTLGTARGTDSNTAANPRLASTGSEGSSILLLGSAGLVILGVALTLAGRNRKSLG